MSDDIKTDLARALEMLTKPPGKPVIFVPRAWWEANGRPAQIEGAEVRVVEPVAR